MIFYRTLTHYIATLENEFGQYKARINEPTEATAKKRVSVRFKGEKLVNLEPVSVREIYDDEVITLEDGRTARIFKTEPIKE